MAIPAQAFGEIYPKDLRPGSIFKFRSNWAMLVTYEDGSTLDFLMLGGEHAGQLFNVGPGMPKCLGVIPPFSWFPAVEESAVASHTEHQVTTLTLTPSGPVIIGANMDGFDPKYFAFRLDGIVARDYEAYGIGLRFADWTAELRHPERPFESLGSLFSIRAV